MGREARSCWCGKCFWSGSRSVGHHGVSVVELATFSGHLLTTLIDIPMPYTWSKATLENSPVFMLGVVKDFRPISFGHRKAMVLSKCFRRQKNKIRCKK